MMELHIRHMPGGKFTDHVFGGVKKRNPAHRRPLRPASSCARIPTSPGRLLLASGTGFAPIEGDTEEHMQHQGAHPPGRAVLGGATRPADLYQSASLQAQCAAMPNLRYVPVVSNAQPEDQWTGRTGFVHQAVLQDTPDLSGHQVYACGAPVVVASAQRDYIAAGLPEEEFFADAFTSELDKVA